jgi:FdhD protein
MGSVTARKRVLRISPASAAHRADTLSVEEPLEVRVGAERQ